MVSNSDLRKEKLKLRDNLKEDERKDKDREIEKKILSLKEINRAENIFSYISFRSEVGTMSFIDIFLREQKEISVPITHVKEKKMDAIKILNLSSDLEHGYCDILEPKKKLIETQKIEPETINVVIVPGSVFDMRGGRFGYGGGYYDRFLEKIPQALRIGLAYEVQLVDRAPLQKHDQLLDYVITEERIINAGRDKGWNLVMR